MDRLADLAHKSNHFKHKNQEYNKERQIQSQKIAILGHDQFMKKKEKNSNKNEKLQNREAK